jgi:hypothetical protein
MFFIEQFVCFSYLITQLKLQLPEGCSFFFEQETGTFKPLLQEGLLWAVVGIDSSELWRY